MAQSALIARGSQGERVSSHKSSIPPFNSRDCAFMSLDRNLVAQTHSSQWRKVRDEITNRSRGSHFDRPSPLAHNRFTQYPFRENEIDLFLPMHRNFPLKSLDYGFPDTRINQAGP